MINYLTDTSIIVDFWKKKTPATSFVMSQKALNISAITYLELLQGARDKIEQTQITHDSRKFNILWLTVDIQKRATDVLLHTNLRDGTGFADSLIAATALEENLALATKNTKHFKSIYGLEVFCPY